MLQATCFISLNVLYAFTFIQLCEQFFSYVHHTFLKHWFLGNATMVSYNKNRQLIIISFHGQSLIFTLFCFVL